MIGLRTTFFFKSKCFLIGLHCILGRIGTLRNYDCDGYGIVKKAIGSVHTRRLVAATQWGDTSQQQIAPCELENFGENLCRDLQQNFVAATCRKKSNQTEFVRLCGDKILLQRQRFSIVFSSTHEAICLCNVSPRHVAATCRLVCTDL